MLIIGSVVTSSDGFLFSMLVRILTTTVAPTCRWVLEGIVTSHFDGISEPMAVPAQAFSCADPTPQGMCFVNVVDYLQSFYNYDVDDFDVDVGVLLAFIVGFRLITAYGLFNVSYLVR